MADQSKEFKFEAADRKRLIELIKTRDLLVTKSVEKAVDDSGPNYYFALSINSEVGESKGLISIKGPRKAPDIKESKLYMDSVALVEAIYEIIHRTDADIDYEPLIH